MNKTADAHAMQSDALAAQRKTKDFSYLVEDDRVHSAVFTSNEIFEAELENIFYRTWVYVGHESEVPTTGDFRLRKIGRQPVIMVRGSSGDVNVMFNRCRHRGAVVAEVETGKTKFFRCWYHGWTYDTEGTLVQVTGPEGYEPGFCARIGGLARPARVDSYRGFIFASLTEDVADLREHLGKAADKLDYLIDASPTGQIFLNAGVNKTFYRGNWKYVGMDGYHVHYVHASVIAVWEEKADSGAGATHRHDIYGENSIAGTRSLGNGHAMLDLHEHRMKYADEYLDFLDRVPSGPEYKAAMVASHGEDRGKELLALAGDPHLGIYPNLQVIGNQVRIINPVSAGETEVLMFPVTLGGVPDDINHMRLRQHESFYGPAGAGSPDDAEIFERVQMGLQVQAEPWIDMSRGLNRERHLEDGTIAGQISDEVPQRGQMREWRRLMRQAEID